MPTKKRSRKQAIREKCLDCCCGIKAEIRKCTATNCPLWPFRMGTEQRSPGTDSAAPEEAAET